MQQSELSAIAAEAKAVGRDVRKVKQAVNSQQPLKLAALVGRTEALAARMRRQLPAPRSGHMNTETGAIAAFENEADAKAAGHDLMLTPEQAEKLLAMPRADRRAWAKKAVSAAELERSAAQREQDEVADLADRASE